jgi:hydroxymethylglutaryl-CoA lyase
MDWPDRVTLCEVGLRDGLQNEDKILSVDEKMKLLDSIIDSGFTVIEAGSFFSPKAVPQMADTDDLAFRIKPRDGVEFRYITSNIKGVERAAASGVRKIKLNVSASVAHSLSNLKRTPGEVVAGFVDCAALANSKGITISGSISTAFGYPGEEEISDGQILALVKNYRDIGVSEVSLSDPTGLGNPRMVYSRCAKVLDAFPDMKIWLHVHNTHGMAMGSVVSALQAGVTRFDASFGGIGGCPFARGATGNIASEDLVNMFEQMGIDTGVFLEKCVKTALMAEEMVGCGLDSFVVRTRRGMQEAKRVQ